ncbi:hypothetical protein HPB47_009177 [Ixodes persulcatus]|uniref:Uncharacterized protein n=1 Tax=Ixodes persulcatus TaxID=34615 RepID=A0AC60P2W6_IXOPE|nr:hypothetical protein HPB47_009177 [Ixodes persulcatus]
MFRLIIRGADPVDRRDWLFESFAGKYSAVTEEEEKEFALLNAELKELAVGVAEELAQETGSFDEYDDEAAAYGWAKWRNKITGAAKKVAKAVIINKVAGIVAGGLG